MTFLEAIAVVVEVVGFVALFLTLVLGIPWVIEAFRRRNLHPSTHVAGPDDEDIDFTAALRSIGGPR